MMIVFLVLMGITGGGYHPAASPLISASVKPEHRGSALGFHLVGGSASFFLAPIIAAGIAAAWGWRGSFLGLAAPTAVFGARRDGWRRLVVFMVLTVLTQAVVFSVMAFIPLFMVDRHGVSEGAAAAYLAIIYSAGLWASPLGGYLSDRLGKVRVVLVVSILSAPLLFLIDLAPVGLAQGALLLMIGGTMYVRMRVHLLSSLVSVPALRLPQWRLLL